jgi:hypothetical protein
MCKQSLIAAFGRGLLAELASATRAPAQRTTLALSSQILVCWNVCVLRGATVKLCYCSKALPTQVAQIQLLE